MKKALKIISNVVIWLLVVICVVLVVATISSKKSEDGGISVFGHQARLVETWSMEWPDDLTIGQLGLYGGVITSLDDLEIKEIPRNSMVFIQLVDKENPTDWYSQLKVGDVLTFMYGEYGVISGKKPVITHRITKITPKQSGGYILELAGDNKGLDSQTQSSPADTAEQIIDTSTDGVNYVIGKVVGQSKLVGNVLYVLKQPVGIVLVVIVPCLAIIIYEIIKIVMLVGKDKRKKVEAHQAEQEHEIELLKKQLEELQNAKKDTTKTEEGEE